MAGLGGYCFSLYNNLAGNIDWLPLTGTVIFLFSNSISQSVLFIICGELLPTTCRSIGVSLVLTEFLVGVFLSTTSYLYMVEALGEYGTFWFFSICHGMIALVSSLALPETRGLSLEEITTQEQEQVSEGCDNPAEIATDSVPMTQSRAAS